MTFVVDRGLYPFESHFFTLSKRSAYALSRRRRWSACCDGAWRSELVLLFSGLRKAMRGAYQFVLDHIGCGLQKSPMRSAVSPHAQTAHRRSRSLARASWPDQKRSRQIAHDWGGMMTGMGYVVRDPSRIKRIALMNTSAFLFLR